MNTHPLIALTLTLLAAPVCAAPLPATVAQAMETGFHSSSPDELRRAAATLESQLRAEPANRELRRALGILYLDRLHDAAAALPHLEKVAGDAPGESSWQQSLARALRANGQMDRAAAHFARAAELAPRDGWVRYELGNTLSGAGHYAEAAAAYRAALTIDGKSIDTRLALARTLWANGELDEARLAAREVLEFDPLNSAARKLLLTAAPPPPAAPAPVAAAAASTPPPAPAPSRKVSPVDAAVAAAWTSGRRSDFESAARALESALGAAPRDLARRKSLAWLYLEKLQQPAAAIPHLREVVAAQPGDASWWELLARAQVATGDRESSLRSYRHAAERAPHSVWPRYHLACTLRDLGRPAEAESTLREALKIEPKNRDVRRVLARTAYAAGHKEVAAVVARELIDEDPRDADAHAVLGDVQRSQRNFSAAGTEYQAALAADPSHSLAQAGIREIRQAQRPEVKLAYYTFDDTDGLRQSGIFSHVSMLLTGRLKASVSANGRFFEQGGRGTTDRFESSLGLDYRLLSNLQLAGGISQFTASDHDPKIGGSAAIYYQPASFADGWISFRSAEPVNDSFTTAESAFSQNILAAGLNLRPGKHILLSATATTAEFSDDNTRRSALLSLGWSVPLPASPVVKLEYEWLDYDRRTSAYSSPQNYGRFRPVLEISPRLTDWLKVELHGELSYVTDESEWGTGYTAGLRLNKGETMDLGASYMRYEIPGGQTTWSGDGFKVDFSARF